MSSLARSEVFRRVATRLGAYDLVVLAPVVGLWSVFGVMNWVVGVALGVVRIAAWVGHVYVLLAPLRAWEVAGDAADDELVRAADDAVQRLHARFRGAYAIGWVVMFALAVGLSKAGIGGPLAVPPAELMTGAMLLLALLAAMADSVPSLVDTALIESRTRVSKALVERKIEVRRPRRSISATAVRKWVTQVMAILVAVTSMGGLVHVHGVRQTAAAELRHQVEISALQVRSGIGPALEGVELVEGRAALAKPLRAELDRELDRERTTLAGVAVFDRERDRVLAAAPLGDDRWAVSEADPEEPLGLIALAGLGLTLLSALPAGLGGASYGRSLVAPIEQLDAATRGFVDHGELQQLARIVPLENDEFGRLAGNFNDMLDMLEELARVAEAVADGDLGVELEHPGDLHDAFRGMLERLSGTVLRLRETSLELASAAAELHALTQEQDEVEQEQAANVRQVSATLGSLAETARDIATTARGALTDAEEAVETTGAMVDKITVLRAQTASVPELLEAIREIADRSDLLALNGSLEATRAGEAGRGFALVAGEMRRLAERVTQTVTAVRGRVDGIETSGAGTVLATEQSRELAERAAEAARTISAVTERQSAHTTQVADGVESVAAKIAAAAVATSQARAAAEGLRLHAAELERLTGEFRLPDDSRGDGQAL